MKRISYSALPAKVIAAIVVLACVVVGVLGLILPVMPGLLFLAIAALVAARYFPSVGDRLRRHRAFRRHFQSADCFSRLSLAEKIRLLGLYCAKHALDGLALLGRRSRASSR